MRILNADEARAFDRWAIESLGVPSLLLMENAALAVADAIAERFPRANCIAIFCGPGNNGGDGLALGRQLATRGYQVELILATFGRPLSNDGSRQLEICQAIGLEVLELGADWRAKLESSSGVDLSVDALFGTGLSRPLEAPWSELVDWLNSLQTPIVAVDLPSGLDASSSRPPGVAVRADLSVTFGAPRIAHLIRPAADFAGEVAIGELGVPFDRSPVAEGALHLRTAAELARSLRPRASDSHKGDYGRLLLVAGSRGMAGAAILAARAALASGAGRVTIATVEELGDSLRAAVPEAMLLPLPGTADGTLGDGAEAPLLAALAGFDVVACGPGLGTGSGVACAVRTLVRSFSGPLLLDADGLNVFAGDLAALRERTGVTVLTPHPGELGRMLGMESSAIQDDRLAAVRHGVAATGAVVVLKGEGTLVARPDGEIGLHRVGNAAMASAGAGDVLCGILAARLAQGAAGDPPGVAADLAVDLHGRAGDLARDAGWVPAIPAGILLDFLSRSYAELAGE